MQSTTTFARPQPLRGRWQVVVRITLGLHGSMRLETIRAIPCGVLSLIPREASDPWHQRQLHPSPGLFFTTMNAHQREALKSAIQLAVFTAIGNPTSNALSAALRKGWHGSGRIRRVLAPEHPIWVEFARNMVPVRAMPAELVAQYLGWPK